MAVSKTGMSTATGRTPLYLVVQTALSMYQFDPDKYGSPGGAVNHALMLVDIAQDAIDKHDKSKRASFDP
jgi:hypothetical protein